VIDRYGAVVACEQTAGQVTVTLEGRACSEAWKRSPISSQPTRRRR